MRRLAGRKEELRGKIRQDCSLNTDSYESGKKKYIKNILQLSIEKKSSI
jgi:hypothetical protein